MINLTSTSDLLRVTTSSAANLDCYTAWQDVLGTTSVTNGRKNTSIASATDTSIVVPPAASTERKVRSVSIRNRHASTANTVTVSFYDGSTAEQLIRVTLAAGERLAYESARGWGQYEAALGWAVYDADGAIKVTGETGATGPAAITAVDSIALLGALDEDDFDDGATVSVASLSDLFVLHKASGLTPDGITVVGNWVRACQPSVRWQSQDEWFIDPAGDDDNDGTESSPLATQAELRRRTGLSFSQDTTIWLAASTEPLCWDVKESPSGAYVSVTLRGERTVAFSGTMLSVQNENADTLTDTRITCAGLSAHVGKMAVVTSGAGTDFCFFVAKDLTSNVCRITRPFSWDVGDSAAVANGVTFDVVTLPAMTGNWLVRPASRRVGLFIRDLDIGVENGASHQWQIEGNGVTFFFCRLFGADVTADGQAFMHGCHLDNVRTYLKSYLDVRNSLCTRVLRTEGGVIHAGNTVAQCVVDIGTSGLLDECRLTVYGEAGLAIHDQVTCSLFLGTFATCDAGARDWPGKIWGTGTTGIAIKMFAGARLAVDPARPPSFTTPTTQIRVGGVDKLFSDVGYLNPTNGAAYIATAE